MLSLPSGSPHPAVVSVTQRRGTPRIHCLGFQETPFSAKASAAATGRVSPLGGLAASQSDQDPEGAESSRVPEP